MKNVLKAKLMVLVLIFGPIDFVLGGCQSCKGNKDNNNQSKSNSNPGGSKDDKEDESKSKSEDDEKKKKKEKWSRGKKKILDQKKADIENFINKKEGNRSSLTGKWKVEDGKDGSFIIKFGLCKVIIEKEEIDKIDEIGNVEKIANIEISLDISRPDKTEYIFGNHAKKLGTFVKSLNSLEGKYRNNAIDEYLHVREVNGKIVLDCYINLTNGLLYVINCGHISRLNNILANGVYGTPRFPIYSDNKYIDIDIEDKSPKEVKYGKMVLPKDVIAGFTFKLKA